jgi:glycosyltransferase involved in cell wall biosynthesis
LIAKKNILILSDWFLPGYLAGGPIQSIATLTKELGNDFNFKIITTDRDFKSDKAYEIIKPNEWTNFENRTVFYLSPENLNESFMLELLKNTPHDIIYLNSLFSKNFTINILKWKAKNKITSKIILAPRGMLGNGALAIKALKKKLFLMYAKSFGLFKNIKWQSTSSQESNEIKKRIATNVLISQISNLPNSLSEIKHIDKKENTLRLCFISRISEKKNLNFAIEVLKKIKNKTIIFDVFGPIEDQTYWNNCLENAKKLPTNITLSYKGILKPFEISSTIGKYHALLLPTQNENYGHIIVETLQHGRPIIISDQTPWRNLENESVGFDIALTDKQKFIEAIEKLSELNQAEFNTITTKCVSYINAKLNVEDIKKQYIKLFNS